MTVSSHSFSKFYTDHGENPELFVKKPIKNLPVVVFEHDSWHRAVVLCVSGTHVMADFIDSGFTKYLKKTNLRYMKECFATTSRKSCRGILYGVKPKNGLSWCSDAVAAFKTLTKSRKMYAAFKDLDENITSLCLFQFPQCDGSGIAENLIKADLASPTFAGLKTTFGDLF